MTEIIDNPHRYRVSSKLILAKIIICLGVFVLTCSWVSSIYNHAFGEKSIAYLMGSLMLIAILYYLSRAKAIEYDDIKCILYVFNSKGKFENEIPVDKIGKILLSAFGVGNQSYVIVFKDLNGQVNKVRLFLIPFKNDIETIITDAKLRNPELITRKWSVSWNEFFD